MAFIGSPGVQLGTTDIQQAIVDTGDNVKRVIWILVAVAVLSLLLMSLKK